MNELYLYLFWLLHIVCGALVDGKIWNKKEDDPKWTKQWIDLYWLGWVAWTPFLVAYLSGIGVEVLSWKSLFIASGMSVVWDFIYCQHESNVWVRALPYWLKIPNPFSKAIDHNDRAIVIGFTEKQMIVFNYIRIAILLLSLFI